MHPEYICSMSGVEAEEDDLIEKADELEQLPVGWTKGTLQRRLENPRWDQIQQTKSALIAISIANVPEEQRVQATPLITIQVDAQFAALEANTDPYIIVQEVFYIAPPESDPELAAEWFSIRDTLGLPTPDEEDENDEAPATPE